MTASGTFSRLRFHLLPALAALVLFSALPAHAAYDHPVTWADMSTIDLRPVFQSQYASPGNLFEPNISESAMELVLRDADSRISQDFRVPSYLRDSVAFWLKIYTEFTTQHVVLFDGLHPEIIYDVLDFRDLSKTARNRAAYEITADRRVKASIKAHRAALHHLAKTKGKGKLSALEKQIVSLVRKCKHKHSYRQLAKGLRTQTGQRDNIIKGLLAAETFLPKMEQIFVGLGLPPEVTRLSLVESSFNLRAVSKVGATGVWQFMYKSGLEFLTIDEKSGIDERLSPLKSTVAAAKLLKRNMRILKSWPLAITSYNHGIRTFLRIPAADAELARMGKVFDACAKRPRLGWASRNYYAEFLAVLHAEAYRHLFYGDMPLPPPHPLAFEQLSKPQTGLSLALERGIGLQEFRLLNPDIKNIRHKLPRGFWLVLPSNNDDFAAYAKKSSAPPARRG